MPDVGFCFRVLFLVLLWGFGSQAVAETAPTAKEGLIDLSEWRFETDGSVRLAGHYEFYWQQFLSGNDLLTAQPPSVLPTYPHRGTAPLPVPILSLDTAMPRIA